MAFRLPFFLTHSFVASSPFHAHRHVIPNTKKHVWCTLNPFNSFRMLCYILQVVILILGCFTICWLPYFIVACTRIFQFAANSSPNYYKAAFSLAMANSGMNPMIYAWKNRTFRRAFIHLLRCQTPDSHALIDDENARQNMKRKSSSLAPSLSAPPPTPNSIISATPPPISVTDTHRSSLHRYNHG